jgi:hypothetical protein
METNPFAPPKTADLDGATAASAHSGLRASEESVQELIRAAPWVRRLVQLTGVSIAAGFVNAVVTASHAATGGAAVKAIAQLLISTIISVLFLVVLRRYAASGDRVARGERSAVNHVIMAQASYIKLTALMTLLFLGALVLVMIAAAVTSLK